MIETIVEMMSFSFMQRAVLVGVMVSLCAALLGVSLVLKRYSMIGDGLSHVGFGIVTVCAAFGYATPLYIAIPGVAICAIVLLKIGNEKKLKSDSAIALISSAALAIGVAVTSVTTGMNTDVCNFMFGSVLSIGKLEVKLSIVISVVVLLLFIVYYRKLFSVTFDEIVIGMRVMGVMLISSIIIFPALTSMRLFKSFKSVIVSSGIVSVIAFLIGIYLSYLYNVSTGAAIVLVNLVFFILFTILERIVNE